tara:strand:+ start:673 stop:1233 length:561 start_codon:yes stop_codon:yes gene_type:complete
MILKMIVSGCAVMCAFTANAETLTGSGLPMKFGIGYGVMVNEESSLEREWVVVNDDKLPVKITQFKGSNIFLDDRTWTYKNHYKIEVAEPISAIEVRFIPFDIWGEKGRTLSSTEVRDFVSGSYDQDGTWRILSENEATEHFAMVAYVAQVKLSSGAVLRADTEAVVSEAQKFSAEFTSGDLSVAE